MAWGPKRWSVWWSPPLPSCVRCADLYPPRLNCTGLRVLRLPALLIPAHIDVPSFSEGVWTSTNLDPPCHCVLSPKVHAASLSTRIGTFKENIDVDTCMCWFILAVAVFLCFLKATLLSLGLCHEKKMRYGNMITPNWQRSTQKYRLW